jgi:hypothetical protein
MKESRSKTMFCIGLAGFLDPKWDHAGWQVVKTGYGVALRRATSNGERTGGDWHAG